MLGDVTSVGIWSKIPDSSPLPSVFCASRKNYLEHASDWKSFCHFSSIHISVAFPILILVLENTHWYSLTRLLFLLGIDSAILAPDNVRRCPPSAPTSLAQVQYPPLVCDWLEYYRNFRTISWFPHALNLEAYTMMWLIYGFFQWRSRCCSTPWWRSFKTSSSRLNTDLSPGTSSSLC